MELPNINLNGADGMDLARQYHEAAKAIEDAVGKMGHLVHGRDYQGAPDGSYSRAREEMLDRIKPMISAYNDLRQISMHCADSV